MRLIDLHYSSSQYCTADHRICSFGSLATASSAYSGLRHFPHYCCPALYDTTHFTAVLLREARPRIAKYQRVASSLYLHLAVQRPQLTTARASATYHSKYLVQRLKLFTACSTRVTAPGPKDLEDRILSLLLLYEEELSTPLLIIIFSTLQTRHAIQSYRQYVLVLFQPPSII